MRFACLAAALLGGCSLVRLPLPDPKGVDAPSPPDAPSPLDAPAPPDAPLPPDAPSPLDAPAPPDAPSPLDAPAPPDAPPSLDAPRPVDAPRPDAPVCVPGCAGDVANDCTSSRDCALAGLTCRVGPSGPECVCRDGALSCAADGRASLECVDGVETIALCDGAGCDAGACDATCDVLPTLAPGSLTFNLCGAGNDTQNQIGSECGSSANGADRTFRIEVPGRSRVSVTLRDADGTVAIDTVVYLRSRCTFPDTQLACDDDVPCADAPAGLGDCTGGVQYRQSSFTVELDRGVYYVYADHLLRSGWPCGNVELVLDIVPL